MKWIPRGGCRPKLVPIPALALFWGNDRPLGEISLCGKKNRTILSVPDRDGRFTWSPGAEKLPTAPGGSWRKDGPGWENAESKLTATSGLCVFVCVCVLCRLHICTYVLQCVVCANKI